MLWLLWVLVFLSVFLVVLLLMRTSIIDTELRHINSFVAHAVTQQEMEAYFASKLKLNPFF